MKENRDIRLVRARQMKNAIRNATHKDLMQEKPTDLTYVKQWPKFETM